MLKSIALLLATTLALAALPAAAADLTRPSDETLLVAAQNGMEELVATRVRNGANVDSTDHRARTALMLAARHNNLRTVELLLDYGADAEKVDREGHTAAMWAARRGHVSVLHAILGHLTGTPAFERQARLALGVIQRLGDRQTERALRELYPEALSRGGAPLPILTAPGLPPRGPAAGGMVPSRGILPAAGGEAARQASPARPQAPRAPGWPCAPPAAPANNPLSELPPIPAPPPELAVPRQAPDASP